jgi:hypothetical protein
MLESLSSARFDHATANASIHLKTPDSGGADLSFVRPIHPHLTHNLLTMSRLALCSHNIDFLGLVRPSCVVNPTPSPTTHNLQPTTHPVTHSTFSASLLAIECVTN